MLALFLDVRVRGAGLGLALFALSFTGLYSCSPTTSSDDDGDDGSTGDRGGVGVTGGAAGAASGGVSGVGMGGSAGLGSGGVGPSGGSTSTGGGAGTSAGQGGGTSGGTSGGTAGAGAVTGTGGAGGSAGGADGAGGNGGGPAGPCGHAGEVFCEDFEDVTTLDPARWTIEKIGEGTVVIDTAIAHSGSKSVHVTQVGYNAFATLKGASLFPTGSRFYLRLFMRLAAPMTGGHHTYFIAGLAATPGAPYETRVGVQNEMLIINQPSGDRGFMSNQNYYNDHLPGAVLAVNGWSCVEVFFDPAASTINVWLDDMPIPDLNRTDWQEERFDVVRFGFESYAGPAAQIWYDDIAVGTQKIGCR